MGRSWRKVGGDRDTNGLGRVRNDFEAIPTGVPVFFGLLAGVGDWTAMKQGID